jgi:hypothetical protein
MFLVMNRNKRAMTLDPSAPKGREIVRKLVATADVVVANLPPEVLRNLSLDLDSLRRVKPDIILTTVTAFGAGGPWSHKHGFDGIGQAMAGSAYLTGTPEQPLRAAVAWVDCGTASLAAFGTLAALMARQKTGRGQKVEGALLRTAVLYPGGRSGGPGSGTVGKGRRFREGVFRQQGLYPVYAPYLGTGPDSPGLIVQGATPEEVVPRCASRSSSSPDLR